MSSDMRITGPVDIRSETEARVAFDLMCYIAERETLTEAQRADRAHWLRLYLQCRRATGGAKLQFVLDPT